MYVGGNTKHPDHLCDRLCSSHNLYAVPICVYVCVYVLNAIVSWRHLPRVCYVYIGVASTSGSKTFIDLALTNESEACV